MRSGISIRLLLVFVCCNLVVVVSAHKESRPDEMCRQFGDLYMRQCCRIDTPPSSRYNASRGFRGKKGDTGARGPAGPPGPQGVVYYVTFDQKIAAAKLELEVKFNETLSRLEEEIISRISVLETAPKERTTTDCAIDDEDCEGSGSGKDDGSRVSVSGCELQYREKCYRAIIHSSQNVNLATARSLCNNIGWSIANLYSREHYYKVASYLRTKSTSSDYISAWLGMTYDVNRKRTLLSNGRYGVNLPWYPGYPKSSNEMSIGIRRNKNSKYQGLVNYASTNSRHGVLCEIS